jgi:hypothetical protein
VWETVLGSDLLLQQIGDIKRNISNTVIAGTGIKIEKILYALPITTPATHDLYSLIYAKGMFVTVGAAGRIFTSQDGINLIQQVSGVTTLPLKEIIYANDLFITVGGIGTVLTSPDSITWSKQTCETIRNLYFLIYANGVFVAIGESRTILTY